MALLSIPTIGVGRGFVLRLSVVLFGGFTAAAAPTTAEAACVAVALNGKGAQIRGTRSITHGVFPRKVCRRALRHCERRLDEVRFDTGRRRPHARCEIIASGPRAADIFGPPLEGWRVAPHRRDRDYAEKDDAYRDDRYREDGYRDERAYDAAPRDFDEPGSHDGWRSAERYDRFDDPGDRRYDERYDAPYADRYAPPPPEDREYRSGDPGRDPLIDDLLRDERGDAPPPPPDERFTPHQGDRSASGCNIDACAARYKTFRPSDCSYKPTLYERRRCPL